MAVYGVFRVDPRIFISFPDPPPAEQIELATPVSQILFEADREACKPVLNVCCETNPAEYPDGEVA